MFPSLETAGRHTWRRTQTLIKEGSQSNPLKSTNNTQVIEEQLKSPLRPTCELTLSKPQSFGKIIFDPQDLISKIYVVPDDKELLLRTKVLYFYEIPASSCSFQQL